MNLDFSLFKIIHSLSGQSICLDSLSIFFAKYLIWFLLAGIFLFLIFTKDKRKKKEIIIFSALSLALFYLLDFLMGKIYFRPRPFIFFNFQPLVEVLPQDSSFPSAHTALAFIIAFSVYLIDKRLGIIYFFLALIIGLARIFTGVHWPSDILGGAVLGFICVLVANAFIEKLVNPYLKIPKPKT